MMERQDRLQQRLDGLTKDESFLGSAIVSRDGIPVLSSFAPELDQRAFSILVEGAMVATLMGSAEEGMAELGGGDVRHVIVDGGELRIVVTGISDDLLFVAVGTADVPHEATIGPVQETLDALREIG